MENFYSVKNKLVFTSGKHTSNNGEEKTYSPGFVRNLASNYGKYGPEHNSNIGVVFSDEFKLKVGHSNKLLAEDLDVPSAGNIVNLRAKKIPLALTKKCNLPPDTVGLYADWEKMPKGVFNIYKSGGFPTVSAEISSNYMGKGPMLRNVALQGLVPGALKHLSELERYSSLYSENFQDLDFCTLSFSDNSNSVFIDLDFSENMPTEVNKLNKDEVEALFKKLIKQNNTDFAESMAKNVGDVITAKFNEHNPKAPELSETEKKLITENKKYKEDAATRDKADQNAMFSELTAYTGKLKKGGAKPVLTDKIEALGKALITPDTEVCKFSEGEPVSLFKAFIKVFEDFSKSDNSNFSEVPEQHGDTMDADIALANAIQAKAQGKPLDKK